MNSRVSRPAETTPDVEANGRPAEPEVDLSDPFNLEALRLTADYSEAAKVEKPLTSVPVRKPSKEWFIRTHPDPAYRSPAPMLELKDDRDREIYLVAPALARALESEPTFSRRLLIVAMNRQGDTFLWPLKPPGPDGKDNDWNRSAREAAEEARTRWVRVTANQGLGVYTLTAASVAIPDPAWRKESLREILVAAFHDKVITDWNHPILRRLRGEG